MNKKDRDPVETFLLWATVFAGSMGIFTLIVEHGLR